MGIHRAWYRLILAAIIMMIVTAGCGSQPGASTSTAPSAASTAPAATTRTITDMAGRQVTLPATITKVVTVGAVPVINSFIFAMGHGDKIVNGLPPFAQNSRYKYEAVFAPNIAAAPVMQGTDNTPNMEEILKAKPDVVFVMNKTAIDPIAQRGIPVVFLAWRQPEDVKQVMTLLGNVFNEPDRAAAYVTYFDLTIQRVHDMVATIPEDQRVKVLYINPRTMSQPHLIAEWWIPAAGGISVTNDGRTTESVTFTIEQVLQWNPDVLVVANPQDEQTLLTDERFKPLKAVANKRIYIAPTGAHLWANRTSEEPLTILWAAKSFYPDHLKDLNLTKEVQNFYGNIYGVQLTDDQVNEILNARM